MPQPAYGATYPFEGDQQAGDAEWRHLASAWGDGIVNDRVGFTFTGGAFGITPSSSDRTVVVTLGELRVRGIHFVGIDGTTTITLTAVAAGYTRVDRIVARYDPSDKSISIIAVAGTAVNTGVPAAPALARNSGGTWDLPLWRFTGGNTAASTLTKIDDRFWIGWQGYVHSAGAAGILLPDAPLGSRCYAIDTGHEWVLQDLNDGHPGFPPSWLDLDEPVWITPDLGPSMVAGPTAPFYSVIRGRVQLRGSIQHSGVAQILAAGATTDVVVGTIGAGARPSSTRDFAVPTAGSSASQSVRLLIGADGVMKVNAQGAGSPPVGVIYLGGVTYLAEQ